MAEHLIRLRGGWHRSDSTAGTAPPGSPPARLSLPFPWPAEPDWLGIVTLVRPFGPPPIDDDDDQLHLRLHHVPGLLGVRLNEREIARPAAGTTRLELPLSLSLPLVRRNTLVLEVDGGLAARSTAPAEAWGEIALVISPRPAGPGELTASESP